MSNCDHRKMQTITELEALLARPVTGKFTEWIVMGGDDMLSFLMLEAPIEWFEISVAEGMDHVLAVVDFNSEMSREEVKLRFPVIKHCCPSGVEVTAPHVLALHRMAFGDVLFLSVRPGRLSLWRHAAGAQNE